MKSRMLLIAISLIFLCTNNLKAQIGDPAPNFTVTDINGNTHTLYDYLNSGKKVLLDFFFTTCGPCQFYSPQVNLAYQKYGCNQGDVVFMSIDLNNNNAEVHAYEQTYNIEFPSISGDDGGGNEVIDLYNIGAFPTFYLIDSTYKIIDIIDPPTLQVFDFRFGMHGINEMSCSVATIGISDNNDLIIYPNPAKDELLLKLMHDPQGIINCEYKILDLTGREYLSGKYDGSKIIINQLINGIYVLQLKQANNIYYTKLLVN